MEWKLEDFKKSEIKVMARLSIVFIAFFILLIFTFKVFAGTTKIDDTRFSDDTVYDVTVIQAKIDERNRLNKITQREIDRLRDENSVRTAKNAEDQIRIDKAAQVGVIVPVVVTPAPEPTPDVTP